MSLKEYENDPEYYIKKNVWVFDGKKISRREWVAISQSFGTFYPDTNIVFYSSLPKEQAIKELRNKAGHYFDQKKTYFSVALEKTNKEWKEFDANPMA